jgi:hypothetical protein
VQLSSEHFERILSALRSDGCCSAAKEKRLRPRVGLRAEVSVVEHGVGQHGIRTTSTVRDVSREGIGLQHCRKMKVGERFLVQLPSGEGGVESILCTARRCQEITSNTFHIGATFIRICDIGPKYAANNSKPASSETQSVKAETDSDDSARIRNAILA